MDTHPGELFVKSIKDQKLENKIAIALYFVISWNVKVELYPLIKKEVGEARKKLFFPVYPNEDEENEIVRSLLKIPFALTPYSILNRVDENTANKINLHFFSLANETLELDLDELDELARMAAEEENYLHRIANEICDILHILDIKLSFKLMYHMSEYLPVIEMTAINALISCDENDIVPTVYQLAGW